jgi:hypothetical protein
MPRSLGCFDEKRFLGVNMPVIFSAVLREGQRFGQGFMGFGVSDNDTHCILKTCLWRFQKVTTGQKADKLLRRPIRNVSHSSCYYFTTGWTANYRCCSQHLTSLELLGLAFSRSRPKKDCFGRNTPCPLSSWHAIDLGKEAQQGLASVNLLSLDWEFHVLTISLDVR